jgi:hypothetical protein
LPFKLSYTTVKRRDRSVRSLKKLIKNKFRHR